MATRPSVATQDGIRTLAGRRRSAALLWLASSLMCSLFVTAQDARRLFALESAAGLRPHNVSAEPVTLHGKKGIRITMSEAARGQLAVQSREEQAKQALTGGTVEQLAVIEGSNSTTAIEAEIAGAPMAGASAGARGFVGLAFRLQNDMRTYDAFYLRPTNGRADDQVRRNHSAQYISHPDWPWFRMRKETPEKTSVRRCSAWRVDEGENRRARGTGTTLRARPPAADACCQRPEDGCECQGGHRALAGHRHGGALS